MTLKIAGAGRVLAIHIDNGLMRKNESTLVVKALKALGLDVKRESAVCTHFPAPEHCFPEPNRVRVEGAGGLHQVEVWVWDWSYD